MRKPERPETKRPRQNRRVKAQRKRVALESTVERAVCEYVESLGDWTLKVGYDGWPDRLVLLDPGRHCWFEFKRRKFGSLTPAQQRRIPGLCRRGERVYVVKSLDDARAALAVEVIRAVKERRS